MFENAFENNIIPPKNSVIAVAMSGGVDSSTSASFLKTYAQNNPSLNWEVFGVSGIFTESMTESCEEASQIAKSIGIQHYIVDLRKEFEEIIIKNFLKQYSEGYTPMPCMLCNYEFKWGLLRQKAFELSANYFSTGHYVRLEKNQNNNYYLGRASDETKDQTYMLWRLNQEQLKHSVFPLANIRKANIIAKQIQKQQESQDICFIKEKTFDFLEKHLRKKEGLIIHKENKKNLGKHMGTHFFTIGQRKGIGLANSKPLYVCEIDAKNNIVYVGERPSLMAKGLIACDANWQIADCKEQKDFEALVKIRYASKPFLTRVIPEEKGFKLIFKEEQEAVTLGQAAVLYDLNFKFMLGGGWISQRID